MVKRQNKDNAGRLINQGEDGCPARAIKIGPSTAYEYCSERLSPFGGLLGLVKFMDVVKFKGYSTAFTKRRHAPRQAQLELLEDNRYKYRIFVTSLKGRPHAVIEEYDKRADCENLIGEAKREGLEAIPSAKFASNYAYFQLVMLAYNIWRSFKMIAEHSQPGTAEQEKQPECSLKGIMDNTIRIARLKLLFLAAKIRSHSGTSTVKYSQHDGRDAGFL
jgi:hypothetical protein